MSGHTNKYESSLILNNENELLLDHVSGRHIQGIVFIEATRQMSTAVVNKFYPSGEYYLMHDIGAEYINFAFPIETFIQLELCGDDDKSAGKAHKFKVKLDFLQNKKTVVSTRGSFSSMDKHVFNSIEERLSVIALKQASRIINKRKSLA